MRLTAASRPLSLPLQAQPSRQILGCANASTLRSKDKNVRRRVHENIQLDQSLRQSRSIWLSLAILLLPGAAAGVFWLISGLSALMSAGLTINQVLVPVLWDTFWGLVLVLADVFLFGRVGEATRRLKLLHADPTAPVRPLPAPFQASIFGPYH